MTQCLEGTVILRTKSEESMKKVCSIKLKKRELPNWGIAKFIINIVIPKNRMKKIPRGLHPYGIKIGVYDKRK